MIISVVCRYGMALLLIGSAHAALRVEHFDQEPATWEGFNYRNRFFEPRTVTQNFGYSAATSHAGGQVGEVGGRINPAGEPAYYGMRLPKPLTLDAPLSAAGKLFVPAGPGHFLVGFFNAETVSGWRTPNTIVARINTRGKSFHCHLEYCTSLWRAGAGVIGQITPGERLRPIENDCSKRYDWNLRYDPASGLITLNLNGESATTVIPPEHRADGLKITHFGLLPVLKAWDDSGEAWIDDLTVNGELQNFAKDPNWERLNNRQTYRSTDTRPRFDFGWSSTHHALGEKAGELGGLVFRGDCRETARMAWYGDPLSKLTLKTAIEARGRVAVMRAISDSTASIGFFNSTTSVRTNSSQDCSIPKDYLGINVEGPSSEGFFFYPVYRLQNGEHAVADVRKAPRIYPDGRSHTWFLRYDPNGAEGLGQITIGLDDQKYSMDLRAGHQQAGAEFDRFGICTPWIDGNSVKLFFDDLVYTSSP